MAQAETISIDIQARITGLYDSNDSLPDSIAIGDIITGTYTYDSETPNTSHLPTIYTKYEYYGPSSYGITLDVKGFIFRTDPSDAYYAITKINDADSSFIDPAFALYDGYTVSSDKNIFAFSPNLDGLLPPGVPVEDLGEPTTEIGWRLYQFSAAPTAFSDTELSGPPDVSGVDWYSNQLEIYAFHLGREFNIRSEVISANLSPAKVPESSTLLLLAFGLLGLAGIKSRFR
jgi:hypothetical protein